MKRGVFVTGTDTGVGKTLVGVTLVRALVARGMRVGVMKPCETGVGEEGPLDAIALRAAAGDRQPLDEVCPVALPLPAAPAVAAHAVGRTLHPEDWCRRAGDLAQTHDFVLVEGAGGLLVPIAPGWCMADLAQHAGLPLLVVARARLGTINHVLLTLEAARARGLVLAGVVLSHGDGPLSDADEENLDWLRRELGDRCAGEIPPLAAGDEAPAASLDVARILAHALRTTPMRD